MRWVIQHHPSHQVTSNRPGMAFRGLLPKILIKCFIIYSFVLVTLFWQNFRIPHTYPYPVLVLVPLPMQHIFRTSCYIAIWPKQCQGHFAIYGPPILISCSEAIKELQPSNILNVCHFSRVTLILELKSSFPCYLNFRIV